MEKLKHFVLPEHTNTLHEKEALSSISLTKEIAKHINELIDCYNEFSDIDIKWKQSQEGTIRSAITYIKDNLLNTLHDLIETLENEGYFNVTIKDYTKDLEKRLDNLINKTTANDELIDIRYGADGKTYTTSGEAIRTNIKNIIHQLYTYNYEWIDNYYVHNTKGFVSNSGFSYIKINVEHLKGQTIEFKTYLSSYSTFGFTDNENNMIFADKGENYVGGYYTKEVRIPFNAVFLVVSCVTKYIKDFTLKVKDICETISDCAITFDKIENIDLISVSGKWKDNQYVDYKGEIIEHSSFSTIKIDVNALQGENINVSTYISANASISFFDINKRFISNGSFPTENLGSGKLYESVETVPVTADTIMISCQTKYKHLVVCKYSGGIDLLINKTLTNKNNVDLPLQTISKQPEMCCIFRKFCCIGDSLASGEHEYTSPTTGNKDLYEYSWGQFIARATGGICYNLSSGGQTTESWINKYQEQLSETKSDCYIIGLGVNDSNKNYTIGTINDVDFSNCNNNALSYYGNYAKIIQLIKMSQPKAKIFCITMPKTNKAETRNQYNNAIREIVERFDNCYLLDFFNYAPEYTGEFKEKYFNGNHMNALGYLWTSWAIMSYINYIIEHNPSEFNEVAFIGTDYKYY